MFNKKSKKINFFFKKHLTKFIRIDIMFSIENIERENKLWKTGK